MPFNCYIPFAPGVRLRVAFFKMFNTIPNQRFYLLRWVSANVKFEMNAKPLGITMGLQDRQNSHASQKRRSKF